MHRYPTDEELNSLIEELEQQKLYAPRHLKGEILLKARKQALVKEAEKDRMLKSSFLLYTFKMAAGMAAAVLLVFMIPISDGSGISRAEVPEIEWDASEEERLEKDRDRVSLSERISSYMNEKREERAQTTDRIYEKFNELFHSNDLGGNKDEN